VSTRDAREAGPAATGDAPRSAAQGETAMHRTFVTVVAALVAGGASGQEIVSYSFDGSFDDATFAVESAIVGQGLVIDHVSHVGDMLARTGGDVGSDTAIFDSADVFTFCSAVVSREVMEADPMNIAYCPYGIFVAERQGAVTVGYRTYPAGPMQQVQTMLDGIAREAVGD
jgi:uncharacterized protein (DUF302 family)